MLKWNRVICVLSRNLRHLEKCFWFPWFCSWPFLDFLFSLVSKTWRNKFPVIGDFLVLWKPDLRLWSIFKPLSTLFFFFLLRLQRIPQQNFLEEEFYKIECLQWLVFRWANLRNAADIKKAKLDKALRLQQFHADITETKVYDISF